MTALPALVGPDIDADDARLIDRLHGRFPLVDKPFAAVAAELGLAEDEVLERLRQLLARGVLARFGPLFQIESAGGCFTLAAMRVPAARFAAVAALVNAQPEVGHSYRRDHALNLWFVLAAESAERVAAVQAQIEQQTGLDMLTFPRERDYGSETATPLPAQHGAA
ncbi:MAG: Lrp/AsnC family transcriptional regulator [Rubrivivax sp.]|nr:Lrp/AsnC family transcriptional regulator [Rubrivivax sp.]